MPARAAETPPGYYLLFILNDAGVPSRGEDRPSQHSRGAAAAAAAATTAATAAAAAAATTPAATAAAAAVKRRRWSDRH